MQLIDDMVQIVTTPFVGTVDIKHLFLLVGLVLVFLAVWLMILEHIKGAAMEVME